MRIKALQHVAFEGPAAVATWASARGHGLGVVRLDQGDPLPALDAFDMLCVLGGPMSVNDEQRFIWLAPEIALVKQAIAAQKIVFGICLGAQMIAKAQGAAVYPAAQKEIGWFEVQRVGAIGPFHTLPETFTPLHWHGETFDLPAGATWLAKSLAVPHQAFALGQKVLGLQFHIEATRQSVADLILNAGDEIGAGPFEQQATLIERELARCDGLRPLLDAVLDELCKAG